MKNQVKMRVTGLLASVALMGCGVGVGPPVESDLVGNWSWVEASGGIAGVTNTPASTGTTLTLLIQANGTVRLRQSGVPDRSTTIEVSELRNPPGYEIRYDETLFGFETQTATLPTQDELLLTDPCCDGFMWRFERGP